MKESKRENSRNPAIGDDSLLDASMIDGTCMNDTALLDQTSVQGDETFKLPANPSNMTVIEEDEEMMKESERENRNPSIGDDSLLYGSMLDGTYMNDTALLDQTFVQGLETFKLPANPSTSNSLQEDSSVSVRNPNFEERDSLEVESTGFDETFGFANEENTTVIEVKSDSVYSTALTTPVEDAPASVETTQDNSETPSATEQEYEKKVRKRPGRPALKKKWPKFLLEKEEEKVTLQPPPKKMKLSAPEQVAQTSTKPDDSKTAAKPSSKKEAKNEAANQSTAALPKPVAKGRKKADLRKEQKKKAREAKENKSEEKEGAHKKITTKRKPVKPTIAKSPFLHTKSRLIKRAMNDKN